MKTKRSFEMLREAADINQRKNAEYGEGYVNHGDVMAGLFPAGIELGGSNELARFALLNLMVVKLVRYCHNFNKGHDDSLLDLTVYASLLRELDQDVGTDNRG